MAPRNNSITPPMLRHWAFFSKLRALSWLMSLFSLSAFGKEEHMLFRKVNHCLVQSGYLSGIVESRNAAYESQWVAEASQCNAQEDGKVVLIVTHSVTVKSLRCSDRLLLHEKDERSQYAKMVWRVLCILLRVSGNYSDTHFLQEHIQQSSSNLCYSLAAAHSINNHHESFCHHSNSCPKLTPLQRYEVSVPLERNVMLG